VGIKMALKIDLYYIPTPISLAVITTILTIAVVASLIKTRGQERHAPPAPAVAPFRTAGAEEIAALQPLRSRRRPAARDRDSGDEGSVGDGAGATPVQDPAQDQPMGDGTRTESRRP
ncbi:tellurium resistance protein TerC, partial [Arthrobacter sp. TMS2-4]